MGCIGNCLYGRGTGRDLLLLVDMIKATTRVRFLRRLGITLIFLPDFISTPFGVVLMLISRYLSKRLEGSRNKRIREMIKYYLAHTGLFSGDANSKYIDPASVKCYMQSEGYVISKQYTGSHSFEANIDPSVWQSWRDMRCRTVHHSMDIQSLSHTHEAGDSFKFKPGWSGTSSRVEEVIHHAINIEYLSRCYEGQNSTVDHYGGAHTSDVVERVTHHSINKSLPSQRYNTGSSGQQKANYIMNIALFLQRHESAMYKMTLNDLRNNYSYHDLIPKGNVIGGY